MLTRANNHIFRGDNTQSYRRLNVITQICRFFNFLHVFMKANQHVWFKSLVFFPMKRWDLLVLCWLKLSFSHLISFFFFFQRALICWFIGYTSAPIKFHSITAYFAQQHMERERKVRETFAEDEIEIKPGHRGNFHFFDQIRKKSFGVIWKIITITLIESFWSYMRNWAVSNKQVSGAVFSSALFSDELMTSF